MPPTAESGFTACAKHSPSRRHLLSDEARTAARASHAPRLTPELEAWADSLDWADETGVHRSLQEAAVLVLKRGLTPAQAQAMAKLADLRLRQLKAPAKVEKRTEVTLLYGGNGRAEPAPEAEP